MALFTKMSAKMDTLLNKVNYVETKLDVGEQVDLPEDDSAMDDEQTEEQRLQTEADAKASADAAAAQGIAPSLAPSITTEAGRAFTRTNRGQKSAEFRPY